MKKAFIFLFSFLFTWSGLLGVAFATVSHQSGQSVSQTKEQAIQRQKTQTEQQTKGTSQRQAKQRGESVSEQEARREAENVVSGVHFRVQVPVTTFLYDCAAKLELRPEKEQKGLFEKTALLFTTPPVVQLITPFVRAGVIDETAKQYWQSQAVAEAPLTKKQARLVGIAAAQAYVYAQVFKQTLFQFVQDMQDTNLVKIREIGKGQNKKQVVILPFSYEDVKKAFCAILKKRISSPEIDSFYRGVMHHFIVDGSIRWHGALNSFYIFSPVEGTCIYTLPFNLVCNSVPYLSQNAVAGISAVFDVSRGWSYSQALEKLKQCQKYRSTVQSVEKYASQLRQRGMAVQALLVERKALQLLLSGHTNLNPASLIR